MRNYIRSVILLFFILLLTANRCTRTSPNNFNVKSTFETRFNPPSESRLNNLEFLSNQKLSSRVEKLEMNISDISVSGNRIEGDQIPPFTAFVSQTFFRKYNDLIAGYASHDGNIDWIQNRVGEIAICTDAIWLESGPNSFGYAPSDSTINIAGTHRVDSELNPVYRQAGSSYLAMLTSTQGYIPWSHPEVTGRLTPEIISNEDKHLDIKTTVSLLFDMLSSTVIEAIEDIDDIYEVKLGGENNEGEFELHYVPQLQSNETGPVSTRNLRSGMAFYFSADLIGSIGPLEIVDVRLIIPIFLEINFTSPQSIQVDIQPLADLARGEGSNSMGITEIVVMVNTPLGIAGNELASLIRNEMISGLTNTSSEETQTAFLSSTLAFSTGFQKYLDGRSLQDMDFDVYTVPTNCRAHDNPLCFEYNGFINTQVMPMTNESSEIACFILGRFR